MTAPRRTRLARALAVAGLAVALMTISPATPAHADTIRDMQWHLDALHIPDAQKITTGAGVIVGVIDTAVDASHPDLQGQVLPGTSIGVEAPNGWSTSADVAHGTGVAGIIAARGGGPDHALGIAPGAKILPVATSQSRTSAQVAEGIRWATEHGAKVIDLSLGADQPAQAVEVEAVRYALSKDVVIVAAAGNSADGDRHVIEPANIPGVVAVSGTDRTAALWDGSVTGPEVAISAPAVEIVTTEPFAKSPSGYGKPTGTSEAAPIVAGAAALIRAKYPNLNAANVIQRLIATAKDQGPPGRDPQFGFGTIRILDALTKGVPTVTSNPLGEPGGGPSGGPAASSSVSVGTGSSSPAGATGPGKSGSVPWVLIAAIGGAVLLVVIVVVVVAARSRGRRGGSGFPPPPGPGYPPPGSAPPPGRPPPGQPMWPPPPRQ